jgi:hypothetical protein
LDVLLLLLEKVLLLVPALVDHFLARGDRQSVLLTVVAAEEHVLLLAVVDNDAVLHDLLLDVGVPVMVVVLLSGSVKGIVLTGSVVVVFRSGAGDVDVLSGGVVVVALSDHGGGQLGDWNHGHARVLVVHAAVSWNASGQLMETRVVEGVFRRFACTYELGQVHEVGVVGDGVVGQSRHLVEVEQVHADGKGDELV